MCKAYRQASKLLSSLGPLQCLQQLLGHVMLFQTSQPFPMPFPLPGMLLCLQSLTRMSLLLESRPDPPGRGRHSLLWGLVASCLSFPFGQHKARHRAHTGA